MTTNIATTKEQSARLLQCGVDHKTADMCWYKARAANKEGYTWILITENYQKRRNSVEFIPTWSLSALLPMLPSKIEIDEDPCNETQEYGLLIYPFMSGWQIDYQYCENDECHCLKCIYDTDLIEACVKAIEWLTANNYKLNEL